MMRRREIDESPHPGPDRPRGTKPGLGPLTVSEYEPQALRKLKSALAVLRFVIGPGGPGSIRAYSSTREVDPPLPDITREDLRRYEARVLAEIDGLASEIAFSIDRGQLPEWLAATQCRSCGSGFPRGARYCSRCGTKLRK